MRLLRRRYAGLDSLTGEPVRSFVAFDSGAGGGEDEVPNIDTIDDRDGVRAYKTRDPFSGQPQTVVVEKPQACSDCLKTAARLLGFDDVLPVRAELEETQAELDRERELRDAAEGRAADADAVASAAIQRAGVAERQLQAAPKPRAKPKARAG
jgi:hypothetical protein